MMSNTQLIFLPGSVNIDPLEAIKKSLAKFPRPVANTHNLGRQYARLLKVKAGGTLPQLAPVVSAPAYPRAGRRRKVIEIPKEKARRIRRELLDAGVTWYGLMKAESRYLPKILHDGEHIEAVIYGQHQSSSAMLAATSERILYLDKKPMVVMSDEVSYEVISGIEFDVHTVFCTVVLHTPVRNYDFKLVNLHCGEKFARYIESQRLERELTTDDRGEGLIELPARHLSGLEANRDKAPRFEDMAGYYWLPSDEEERRKIQEFNA